MSNICLSVPRESSYNLPPIPSHHIDRLGLYIGPNPAQHLWPPGPRDKAPGAIRSVEAGFGRGLDRGALRRHKDGYWEMLEFGPTWIPWTPLDDRGEHWLAACAFNRYGVGWSFGPAHNLHDEAYGKWEELCGSPPEPIQKWDIDYSLQLWRQLDNEWRAKFGQAIELQEPSEPTKLIEPTKPAEPAKPIDPIEPIKPIEPKPQEPSTPNQSNSLLVEIHEEVKATRLDLDNLLEITMNGIGDIIRAINHPAKISNEIDEHVMIERQWWHDNLSALANEWSTKRPQLARQLIALLEVRKLGEVE